ncbi:hypothetical protein Tco_1557420 [Tanacetum coccineum]
MFNIGSIDLEALHSRMSLLKGQDSGNSQNKDALMRDAAKNDDGHVRESIRVLQNPNSLNTSDKVTMFGDGAARALSYSSLGENVMGVSATGNPINPTDDAFLDVTDTSQDRFTSLPKGDNVRVSSLAGRISLTQVNPN